MTTLSAASRPYRVLVVGASYGLLPASRIAVGGHHVTVVGRTEEITAIAASGVVIAFSEERHLRPPMGDDGLSLRTPATVEPADFDLVLLAVQEPQVSSPDLRRLLEKIGDKLPIASIMNMPPPPYLARISTLPPSVGGGAYGCPEAWAPLPSERMTLASPDPQAFRPDPACPGHLRVTLASNFKFAPFARPEDQAILERITRDASRAAQAWGRPPVHLLARSSTFVPLSKWPMLVTGNCRCVQDEGLPLSIRDAVHADPVKSRILFEAVYASLSSIGAPASALVPFDAYLEAAQNLTRPSSLAMGLAKGAEGVERVDMLVLELLRATKADPEAIDMMAAINSRIEKSLAENRRKTAAP